MAKYKIEYEREGCIGAGACANVAPDFWIMMEDGKASIKNASKVNGTDNEELIIDEKDLEINKHAALSCPVRVIKIKNLETGEMLQL